MVEGPHGGADTPAHATSRSGAHPEQDTLFPDSALNGPAGVTDELVGYRGPAACQIAGITYRQLDYWARTGLLEPSVRPAQGSGTQRLYSFRDILVLKVIKKLLDSGVSLHNIRTAVEHLRRRGAQDLAQITLMSDGTTIYELSSPDEVVDLLQGGQAVFGIAVGRVVREVEGSLAALPAERADDSGQTVPVTEGADELAHRRRRRTSA